MVSSPVVEVELGRDGGRGSLDSVAHINLANDQEDIGDAFTASTVSSALFAFVSSRRSDDAACLR